MKFGFIAIFLFCTCYFTSYQGCRFLLHSARSFIQTGLYKGVIAGKIYKTSPKRNIDNKIKESSVHFTLSFHAHRDKMESVNQNLIVSFIWTLDSRLEPRDDFKVAILILVAVNAEKIVFPTLCSNQTN